MSVLAMELDDVDSLYFEEEEDLFDEEDRVVDADDLLDDDDEDWISGASDDYSEDFDDDGDLDDLENFDLGFDEED